LRGFQVFFRNGKYRLLVDCAGYSEQVTAEQLTEKLQEWEDSCYQESIARVWICQACRPGCRACAKICNTEPDRCIYESDFSEEELQELQDDGNRAPVDWTEGHIHRLPIGFLTKLRANGQNSFADRSWCELTIEQAKFCLEADLE
jgi:hypothetical protein